MRLSTWASENLTSLQADWPDPHVTDQELASAVAIMRPGFDAFARGVEGALGEAGEPALMLLSAQIHGVNINPGAVALACGVCLGLAYEGYQNWGIRALDEGGRQFVRLAITGAAVTGLLPVHEGGNGALDEFLTSQEYEVIADRSLGF